MKCKCSLFMFIVTIGCVFSSYADTLSNVYQQALLNDPKTKKIGTDVASKVAEKNIAKANLLPHVAVQATYKADRLTNYSSNVPNALGIKNNFNSFQSNEVKGYGIGIHQEVINFQAFKNFTLAQKKIAVAQLAESASKQELILRTIDAYIDVLKKIDQIKATRAEKQALSRELKNTLSKYQVGSATDTEANFSQAEFYGIEAKELDAKNALLESISALYNLTNNKITTINQLNVTKFRAESGNISNDSAINKGLNNNISLMYYKALEMLSKEGIKVAQAGHLPTVSFDGQLMRVKQGPNKLKDLPYRNSLDQASISLNLSIPFHSGGQTLAEVDKQKAGYLGSASDYERERRQLISDITSTINNLRLSHQSIIAFSKYKDAAVKALESVREGYNTGLNTIDELLVRIKSLYEADFKLSEARYNNILATSKLKLLEGTLTEKDIAEVSNLFVYQIQLNQFN